MPGWWLRVIADRLRNQSVGSPFPFPLIGRFYDQSIAMGNWTFASAVYNGTQLMLCPVFIPKQINAALMMESTAANFGPPFAVLGFYTMLDPTLEPLNYRLVAQSSPLNLGAVGAKTDNVTITIPPGYGLLAYCSDIGATVRTFVGSTARLSGNPWGFAFGNDTTLYSHLTLLWDLAAESYLLPATLSIDIVNNPDYTLLTTNFPRVFMRIEV